ncbi:MAG TPA: alpha/beta hydrolase family protein [Anaerolineales bacterium]|nr:alpha/beta hydrolase family protein [Anaerolineales bacterium]
MKSTLTPDNYVHQLATDTHRQFAFSATTKTEFNAWQRRFRPHLRAMLGLDAIAGRGTCDLRPRQMSEETLSDHVREAWIIQTEPGFEIPFYLLWPLEIPAGPLPIVLTPHGHGKAGKRTYAGLWDSESERLSIVEGERDVALQAVREGYVAIAPDMRAFASLRLQKDIAANITSSCRDLQMRALLFGRTLIGERVWDIGRLIDYAATRPEVDVNRIVITGNSGGGTISLFAAACDSRITIAAPSSYFCTFEASIGSIHHCECNYVPGMMTVAEMYDVAGLIAPRPFLAVAGREDPIFPYAGVTEAFARLRHIYDIAGAP